MINIDSELLFFESLAEGALAITPNQRLSNTWQLRYARWQQSTGKDAWPRPAVMPWNSLLAQCYQSMVDSSPNNHPFVLNKHQQRYLWQDVIASSSKQADLLHVSATAQTASQAWITMQNWRRPITEESFACNPDSQAFYHWSGEYSSRLSQLNAIDSSQLCHAVIQNWQAAPPIPAAQIILVAFNEFTPQQQAFLNQLESQVTLSRFLPSQGVQTSARVSCADTDSEWKHIARWAKQRWHEEETATIACVIPNLQMHQHSIMRHFQEQFTDDIAKAVNISAGEPLSRLPIIAAALDILSLHHKTIEVNLLSRIILSPFIDDASAKQFERSIWDLSLRDIGEKKLNLGTILTDLEQQDERIYAALRASPVSSLQTQSITEWAKFFSEKLEMWGWPNKTDLSSREQQAMQGWLNLLNEYIKLDIFDCKLNYSQAFSQLRNMASNTDFHFASPVARVQILGVLEAAGLPFDYIWMSGMDDEMWPPYAKANPFIPRELQIEYDMPHASANRELHFCQNLILNFKSSCRELIYSYAQRVDAKEKQLSPLIKEAPHIELTDLALADEIDHYAHLHAQSTFHYKTDCHAPALQRSECIQGGSDILRLQAACPFRAFATLRLGAAGLPQASTGLNAAERGMILHQCLEKIWQRLRTQQHLLSKSHGQLSSLVSEMCQKVLQKFASFRPNTCHKNFIQLEKTRLQKLLLQWLDYEKQRPAFTVLAQEKKVLIELAGIPIHLRVDRIDSDENANKIIIDYKTSLVSMNDWFTDRPNEPQLPLYAISVPEIAGILFAQVRADQMRFQGLSEHHLELEGAHMICDIDNLSEIENWQALLEDWQDTLTQLASEFSDGFAAVAPKDANKTCSYCELTPLCRIHEQNQA